MSKSAPDIIAAADRVANEIELHGEQDPFTADLRTLVAAVRAGQSPSEKPDAWLVVEPDGWRYLSAGEGDARSHMVERGNGGTIYPLYRAAQLPHYRAAMKQAEGDDGIDSVTLVRVLQKKVADQQRELARLNARASAPPEAAQDLVDFVIDFNGMVPGDHLLRLSERLGLPRNAEAWDIVKKRLTGDSEPPKALPDAVCLNCGEEINWADQPSQLSASRCYCGAHEWPPNCVQIEDSHHRLHTQRGCQPGASVTKPVARCDDSDGCPYPDDRCKEHCQQRTHYQGAGWDANGSPVGPPMDTPADGTGLTVAEFMSASIAGETKATHDPGMAPGQILARARVANSGKWPEELTSGVMFYEGQRITRDQFERGAPSEPGSHP